MPMFLIRKALLVLTCIPFLVALLHAQEPAPAQESHPAFGERVDERHLMVREHIENYPYQKVVDPEVLKAMRRVPRHAFVPDELQALAYENRPLPIGHDQTISQPFIVAHMTELLKLESHHKVLEIGTGSGYQAAILAELCDSVFSIEIVPQLASRSSELFRKLGYHQIHAKEGNGYLGWPEHAPFDRMIVTCAPDNIPQALVEQLAPEGLMIIPVGNPRQVQYLVQVKKDKKGRISSKTLYPVRFVPMTGSEAKQ